MEKIETKFGFVLPLGETDEVSTSILEILPGKKIEKHFHKKTLEIELILYGEVIVNGKEKVKGDILRWNPGIEYAHEYENKGFEHVRVLCVAMPKYDPTDEYVY